MVVVALAALVIAGIFYWLIVVLAVERFFREKPRCPTGIVLSGARPSVSVLKPVKGADANTYENFASFCRQRYSGYEVLFGVADLTDPAVPVIERLQRAFPALDIRCFVAPLRGVNPKCSILQELVARARHHVLVLCDDDIRVEPDYLARVISDLEEPPVGLATCLYRCSDASPAASVRSKALSAFEMSYIEGDFLPSMIMAHRVLGVPVGLGATIALRREDLDLIGGFAALADHLSDDCELATRFAEVGLRTRVSQCVVEHFRGDVRLADQWRREIRWSRGIRVRCLWEYLCLPVKFSVPLAVALVWMEAAPLAWPLFVTAIVARLLVAWRMQKHLRVRVSPVTIACAPLRDFISLVVWVVALAGRRIRWRGQDFLLSATGRLKPAKPTIARRMAVAGVRWIDHRLRKAYAITEYSNDPQCICRIALVPSDEEIVLPDGARIAKGETVGELHFWNEHLPRTPPNGPDLCFAVRFLLRADISFRELAAYIGSRPELWTIKAWRGTAPLGEKRQAREWARVMSRLGFTAPKVVRPLTLWHRWHDLGEDFFLWALTWSLNPDALRNRPFRRRRYRYWLPQSALLTRYAGGPIDSATNAAAVSV